MWCRASSPLHPCLPFPPPPCLFLVRFVSSTHRMQILVYLLTQWFVMPRSQIRPQGTPPPGSIALGASGMCLSAVTFGSLRVGVGDGKAPPTDHSHNICFFVALSQIRGSFFCQPSHASFLFPSLCLYLMTQRSGHSRGPGPEHAPPPPPSPQCPSICPLRDHWRRPQLPTSHMPRPIPARGACIASHCVRCPHWSDHGFTPQS